MKLAPVV